ncbi:hypothetical protein [Serratia sp. Nf2]|uniref:hypothetical protein n=1 Tax=Serratia sp. Nf2 TaxID=2116540 RepID=UPI000D1627BC|nr:hypothetical protein [Serratia sp. Nf2]PTA77735.1 hypothetical protein C9411_11110 [Serratia sp. Nf2]
MDTKAVAQGIIEQAAVSSRRLRELSPSTYHKLTPRNLDMIYFLAEEYLEPFVGLYQQIENVL